MRNLSEVESFGGSAAEDDDVRKYFVRTPAFEAIWDGKKHIVIGRKGSGKTALDLALADRAATEGRHVVSLTFKQYPWAAHYKYASTEVDQTERYVAPWTFLILIEAFTAILRSRPTGLSRERSQAFDNVEKFIEANYGGLDFDFKKALPAGGLKVETIDLQPSVMGNSLGKVSASKKAPGLGETLQRVNEWLEKQLIAIGAAIPTTFVTFDELDLGFALDNRQYTDRVTGLLLAARAFVVRHTRKGVPIHPIVFLRSDIFERLHFGDKNKITNSELIDLKWHDRLDHQGPSLKHLIDWRIKEVLDIDSIEAAWHRAFDKQLTRGTQHKFQHITFRTFLRPRDVIEFSNAALVAAQRRRAIAPTDDEHISNADLKVARMAYSAYLLRELDDEIAEAVPNWQDYLEVLRQIGAAKFTRDDFDSAYAKTSRKLDLKQTADQIFALFYEYSVIGFERKAPGGSGLAHHFRYLDETVLFEPNAREFLVHRGLKESLGLTEIIGSDD